MIHYHNVINNSIVSRDILGPFRFIGRRSSSGRIHRHAVRLRFLQGGGHGALRRRTRLTTILTQHVVIILARFLLV